MPRPRGSQVHVKLVADMPPELMQRLDQYCDAAGRTRRDVLIECITAYLDQRNVTITRAEPV